MAAFLYLDGAQVGSVTPPAGWSFGPGNPFQVARSSDSFWRGFNGSVGEVRMYNRVLGQDEIRALYSSY